MAPMVLRKLGLASYMFCVHNACMAKKKAAATRKPRYNLALDARVMKRVEDVIKRAIPRITKQRFIEDAVIRRLGEDWRGL